MKFERPTGGVPWFHVCLFDKTCRAYDMPPRLYLHFLVRKDGSSLIIPLGKQD